MTIRRIEKEITKLCAKLNDEQYQNVNEAQTQCYFIEPFLRVFGWDTSLIDVITQFHIKLPEGNDKIPDYVLQVNGEIKTVIEVKRLNSGLSKHIPSLSLYFEKVNAHIGILTNGQQWWFFSWHRKKKEMNETPFAVIDIRDLRLKKEDSFLLHFRQDKFNADYFKCFSHADYLSAQAHGALGNIVDKNKKIKRLARKMFFALFRTYSAPNAPNDTSFTDGTKMSHRQIKYLYDFTGYHSRWAFRHYRVRIEPMRK